MGEEKQQQQQRQQHTPRTTTAATKSYLVLNMTELFLKNGHLKYASIYFLVFILWGRGGGGNNNLSHLCVHCVVSNGHFVNHPS